MVIANVAAARVDERGVSLLEFEVVEVDHRRDANEPVDRAKRGKALKEFETKDEVLVDEELIAIPEEVEPPGAPALTPEGVGSWRAVMNVSEIAETLMKMWSSMIG